MCVVVVIVHWHCSAQLSMFNMEKRYRNKIIINACVHRLDLGLYSHPKEFWGNGVRTHVNSKG